MTVCSVGGATNIGSFNYVIDNDPNWYRGADRDGIAPPEPDCGGVGEPECEYDMQMVATHEFGHVLGIDHLDAGGGCPAGGGAATM